MYPNLLLSSLPQVLTLLPGSSGNGRDLLGEGRVTELYDAEGDLGENGYISKCDIILLVTNRESVPLNV